MSGRNAQVARIPLAIVLGSTRQGRFCDTVAAWVHAQVARDPGFEASVIDPADGLPEHGESAALRAHARMVRGLDLAEAFIVVVPEYNHGYPAPLKALIDATRLPWQAKPVAFVSYGGLSGGIRAVEQLRQVFAELHAVAIRDAVSFANASQRFDPEGRLRDPRPAEAAMSLLLERLRWWALSLRGARKALPYPQAA